VNPGSDVKSLREPGTERGGEHCGKTGFRVLLLEDL